MAIKIGKESVQNSGFTMYQGVGAFNVVAVNPTKEELSKLQNREITEDIVYAGKDDMNLDTMRVVFWLKSNPEFNNGIELLTSLTFNLTKSQRVSTNSGKVQVIDKYGRTAWATTEDIKNKAIPQYANGPANISADYRPAFVGEEYLVKFLQTWLNIPNCMNYINGSWVMKEDPSDSEVSLNVQDVFSGKLEEIKELVKLAASYMVKCAVGVRTTDEGKQYHNVFAREFVKNSNNDYSKIEKAVTELKNNGGAANVEYDFAPLHEYVVTATNFKEETPGDVDESFPW